MSGIASVIAAQRVGVPVVITYHALGAEKRLHHGVHDTSPTGRLEVEDWLARGVDHVIATTALEAATVTDMGAMNRAVSVIPCGVDLDLFRSDGPAWPARRGGVNRVVCVNRLVPRKGTADVVAAMRHVPDTELLIAGGPPEAMLSEDPEAIALWDLARRLGVEERVQLLGALDRRDVPALMRSADVVACCPWYEPFGLVAVEAMACGVPVIATHVGGLAETVLHGRTGFHVATQSPRAIAEAVRCITGPGADWASMSSAARRRGAAYHWDRIGAETLEVYRRVARRGRKCFAEEMPPLHGAPLSTGGRPVTGDQR
jgi:D-inositol-3-phosphate glycosyltransferase